MPLTDIQVKGAKANTKDYKLADGHGVYLLVTASGSKLWRWKYRFGDREKLMALGSYPAVTLAAARNKFAEARTMLQKWKAGKDERYVVNVERRLTDDVLARIGDRPIDEIEAPELVKMVCAIEERGASDVARRALQMTSQIFRYGIATVCAAKIQLRCSGPATC
jgi:hypothetical protein